MSLRIELFCMSAQQHLFMDVFCLICFLIYLEFSPYTFGPLIPILHFSFIASWFTHQHRIYCSSWLSYFGYKKKKSFYKKKLSSLKCRTNWDTKNWHGTLKINPKNIFKIKLHKLFGFLLKYYVMQVLCMYYARIMYVLFKNWTCSRQWDVEHALWLLLGLMGQLYQNVSFELNILD